MYHIKSTAHPFANIIISKVWCTLWDDVEKVKEKKKYKTDRKKTLTKKIKKISNRANHKDDDFNVLGSFF